MKAKQGNFIYQEVRHNGDDDGAISFESYIEQNIWKFRVNMFLCGLINNTGYVVVSTSAQNLAKSFKKEDLMSAFNFSLIFLSIGMVILNAKIFIKIQHKIRIYIMLLLQILGFITIAYCTTVDYEWAFYVALIGAAICGCMQAFGETTMLGYCKSFSSSLIGLWASGTGFAGIFGAGFYLTLSSINLSDFYIFLLLSPLLIVYYASFSWLENTRSKFQFQSQVQYEKLDINATVNEGLITNDDSTNNSEMTIQNIKLVFGLAWKLSLNLGLVYFFEYFCLVSWIDRANPKKDNGSFLERKAYPALTMSYQIGVFLSRSSLEIIKIPKVWILTLIQGFNWLGWGIIAIGFYSGSFTVSIYFQIILMIWVGLMGGASYVNVNYLVVYGEQIPRDKKELCMNVNSITNNTGVLLATICALIVSNFWLVSK